MSAERRTVLRAAVAVLVASLALGTLLATRVGVLGALAALALAGLIVGVPAAVFVRRERARLIAAAARARAPVHCTCCDGSGRHTTAVV